MAKRIIVEDDRRRIRSIVEKLIVDYCDIPQAQIHLLRVKAAADNIDDALQNLGAISQMAADTVGS